MAAIKNPKCPNCGDSLQYRTLCYYALTLFDPVTGECEHGGVEDEEDEPGIWCPSCGVEVTDEDLKEASQEQADAG